MWSLFSLSLSCVLWQIKQQEIRRRSVRSRRCGKLQLAFAGDARLISRTEDFAVDFQVAADHENIGTASLGQLVCRGFAGREERRIDRCVLVNLDSGRMAVCPILPAGTAIGSNLPERSLSEKLFAPTMAADDRRLA